MTSPKTNMRVFHGKINWYEVLYDQCRGGKQFEDRCRGCRGCGPEERRIKHKNWFTVIRKGEKGPPPLVTDRFGRLVHPSELRDEMCLPNVQ